MFTESTTSAPPGFVKDVKPYFTDVDQQHMLDQGLFDLYKLEDVRDNFDDILDSLMAGRMPKNNPWPQPKRDQFKIVFEAWKAGGFQP